MLAPANVVALVGLLVSDPHGLLLLANALDSFKENLIDDSVVRDLLGDVADELDDYPASRWPDALARVCSGRAKPRRRPNGYLRAGVPHKVPEDAGLVWTTVVSAAVWKDKHLDTTKISATPLPAFPPVRDAPFQKQFDAITARPDWFQTPTSTDGAWLGRPASEGANCWVSRNDMDAGYNVSAKSLNGSARRVVEALGILPKSPLNHYIRYSVNALSARSIVSDDGRRPCFADQGNEWFRVVTDTPRSKHYRNYGWGATTNLSAIRAKVPDDTGRPERVCPSIPMRNDLRAGVTRYIEVLYPNDGDKRFASAPSDSFRHSVLRGRSDSVIASAVLNLWDITAP